MNLHHCYKDYKMKYAIPMAFKRGHDRKKVCCMMMMIGLFSKAVSHLTVTDTAFPRGEVERSCWTSLRCRYIARTTIQKNIYMN